MDANTVFKIEDEARIIYQRWRDGWNIANNPQYHETCWLILDSLPGTIEEIAESTKLNDRTISQALNALERGGVPIRRMSVRRAKTGRPRVIFSL
jgi:predicted ArsR family transcriptional regulator